MMASATNTFEKIVLDFIQDAHFCFRKTPVVAQPLELEGFKFLFYGVPCNIL